jgi:hypothetical protein
MSLPMIKGLKNKEEVFAFIPSDYFKLVLDVLVYSFSDDQIAFDLILITLKEAFSHYWESIEKTRFNILLDALINQLLLRNPRWFKNL